MVGVMALLIALALMTGLQGELRDRIVGSAAHVYVLKVGGITDADAEVEKLLPVPRVTGAAPVVLGKGLLDERRRPGVHRNQGHRAGAGEDRHANRDRDA